ncbi:MAG: glycerol acyltransferase [Oscillochloris sp.]|nr:glycerol acyltransferase [Oscillochloris sp.]
MSDNPLPAIPAAKNPLGDELLYLAFARRSFRRFFDHVWMQHIGPLPTRGQGPYIFYLTHSGWWDAYMLMVIHRLALGRPFESYVIQEEKQLRAYRFFTWCGAFSINRHDPEDTRRSLQYAANLLRGHHNCALYIFPQGKIVPPDRRPLLIYPGLARIVALVGEVKLCPIALRYDFLGEQWPHAFIRIGPIHQASDPRDIERTSTEIAAQLTAAADGLRDDVLAGKRDRFRPLISGRKGIDTFLDRILALARIR